jgi:hypothetical protein
VESFDSDAPAKCHGSGGQLKSWIVRRPKKAWEIHPIRPGIIRTAAAKTWPLYVQEGPQSTTHGHKFLPDFLFS